MAEISSPADPPSHVPSTVPHLLPPPFKCTKTPPSLITQGAEAIVFRTQFLTAERACALKYRPAKSWRHPTLDARLTRHRILSEARILVKCRREGVRVPGVLSLDWEGGSVDGKEGKRSGGWMMMEWIEGDTVRNVLDKWLKAQQRDKTNDADQNGDREQATELMKKIGRTIGKLHKIGIVHGDLTTSNLMLRPLRCSESLANGDMGTAAPPRISLEGDIVLIDFGLAAQSLQDEDKAVDLYVLERAFGSTHPTTEDLFQEFLKAYGTSYKGAQVVLRRLEDVRMRGRKRSMLG
ncbi:serine/threonine-protein kinase bud32 [Trapelia coarctata]|nr:serine/threonine-protein kinase bud32 [Trapelia coarctata]